MVNERFKKPLKGKDIFFSTCVLCGLVGGLLTRLTDNTDGRKPKSYRVRVISILSGKIQEVLSSNVLEFRRPRKKSKALLLSV